MLNITHVRRVEIDFTPEDWSLYSILIDDNPESAEAEHVREAARSLNQTLEQAVNGGLNRADTTRVMSATMQKFSAAGANDSEPYYVLEDVLNKIYS